MSALLPLAPALAAAALTGLIGSPHCVGMCGGFACAAGGRTGLLAWTGGRLLTYAALGAAVGALGLVVPGPSWLSTALAAALLLFLALRLAGLGPSSAAPPGLVALGARLLRRPGAPARLALGMTTGLLPCGLVYAALSLPVVSGGPVAGALSMVAFGLGTAPALALLAGGLQRVALRSPVHRRALAFGVFVMGMLSLGARQLGT
jgi:sulfite exporter TauE/SafE